MSYIHAKEGHPYSDPLHWNNHILHWPTFQQFQNFLSKDFFFYSMGSLSFPFCFSPQEPCCIQLQYHVKQYAGKFLAISQSYNMIQFLLVFCSTNKIQVDLCCVTASENPMFLKSHSAAHRKKQMTQLINNLWSVCQGPNHAVCNAAPLPDLSWLGLRHSWELLGILWWSRASVPACKLNVSVWQAEQESPQRKSWPE